MTIGIHRLARMFRVAKGRRRGIRAVPAEPGPEFPEVAHACAVRPARCGECGMPRCYFGQVPGAAP